MTDRYAAVGNLVAHSTTSEVHVAFARATGEDAAYERLLAGKALTAYRRGRHRQAE